MTLYFQQKSLFAYLSYDSLRFRYVPCVVFKRTDCAKELEQN